MGIRVYRPVSKGRRNSSVLDFAEITRSVPEKSLLEPLRKTGGRNNTGRVTCRHIGGGNRRFYRLVDFRRDKDNIPAAVESIEYDPNRSCRIALLHYADGEKRYIPWPVGVNVGDTLMSGENVDIRPGNCLPLKSIPLGTVIHNVEMKIGAGGQLARSAGTTAQLMAKEGDWGTVRLPSGEMRKVHLDCRATIGQIGNVDHTNVELGKAGRKRWLGRRPHNRGVTMNPVDHPMGGGEGRSSGGRHPCSPWGQQSKGLKTRHNKATDKFIVRRRKGQ